MLEVLMFVAGIQMMIELLAAGYRFIDLKYRLGHFWVRLTSRALILLALDAVLLTQLPDMLASAFLWGQAAYLVFHIGVFWLIRAGLSLLRYKPK
jgi:hypothetical protein